MSYRDDDEAAHHRRDALEREVLALERRQHGALTPRRRVDWSSVIPVSIGATVSATFTALAITLAWGTGWAIAGFAVTSIVLLALIGSGDSGLPHGAIAVRLDFEAPCVDGRVATRLLATVRLGTEGELAKTARQTFPDRPRAEVAETAASILEGVVREQLAARRQEELADRRFVELTDGPARGALTRAGLVLIALWVGPA